MDKRTLVVVYGCSLNLAGIAASLKADPGLEVHCFSTQTSTAQRRLRNLNPAVILFDLSNSNAGLDLSLLRQRPGLVLVGIDPSSEELLVLNCNSSRAHSVADLIDVIRNNTPARAL